VTAPVPVRSHRMPLVPRSGRRWIAWLAVLVTLLLGYAISQYTPGEATQQRPFVSTGSMHHVVSTRPFDAMVTGVRGASAVEVDLKKYTTSGVWVVVTMRLLAHPGKPVRIGYAGLVDAAGRKYDEPGRFSAPAFGCQLEPGVPVTAQFVFEVPVAVATGLSIEVAPGLDQRMGAMVRIAIPVPDSAVAGWRQTTTPLTVDAPKVAT
jgi:hypothetical protein